MGRGLTQPKPQRSDELRYQCRQPGSTERRAMASALGSDTAGWVAVAGPIALSAVSPGFRAVQVPGQLMGPRHPISHPPFLTHSTTTVRMRAERHSSYQRLHHYSYCLVSPGPVGSELSGVIGTHKCVVEEFRERARHRCRLWRWRSSLIASCPCPQRGRTHRSTRWLGERRCRARARRMIHGRNSWMRDHRWSRT